MQLKKRSLIIGGATLIILLGLFVWAVHWSIHPTWKNHIIIVNQRSDDVRLAITIKSEVFHWNGDTGIISPDGVRVINYPEMFPTGCALSVSSAEKYEGIDYEQELATRGRYGHTLIILLSPDEVEQHWDSISGKRF